MSILKSILRRTRDLACRPVQWLTTLWRGNEGTVLATFGLALPVTIGVLGLSVESGLWYAGKRALQTQADAAARSGAFERARGNPGNVSAAALRDAERNGFINVSPATFAVHNPPISGSRIGSAGAVEVVLSRPESLLFAHYFLDTLAISARAVAIVDVTGTACVLALHPTLGSAITNQGNVTVDLDGCTIAANSNHAKAIDITGSGYIKAESLWTAGNYYFSGSASMDLAKPPMVNAWALDDPYKDVTIPSFGSCDVTNASYSNVTMINPGVYCNGLAFGSNANVTLNPGTYYIDKGDLQIAASARLRCACVAPGDGVTFVLTSSTAPGQIGVADVRGGADVLLGAPTDPSDPFTGLLIYQDPRAPSNGVNSLNGGASMSLSGAVYFSKQVVRWSGANGPSAPTCTQVVASNIVFIGNATINNTGCESMGVKPIEVKGVRLVE